MVLHSWKWTWSPVLLMLDTAKTNAYSQHVLLCADFNTHNDLLHTDTDYLRPMAAKEFYRVLGLKMMKYQAQSGYFCESAQSQAKGKRRREAAAAAIHGRHCLPDFRFAANLTKLIHCCSFALQPLVVPPALELDQHPPRPLHDPAKGLSTLAKPRHRTTGASQKSTVGVTPSGRVAAAANTAARKAARRTTASSVASPCTTRVPAGSTGRALPNITRHVTQTGSIAMLNGAPFQRRSPPSRSTTTFSQPARKW